MRSWAKVLLVWGVLTALFAVFNLLYWPVYRKQAMTHPEAFVDYARTLPPQEARRVLREGIAQFNPPWDVPYVRLSGLEKQTGNTDNAFLLEARAGFYGLLRQDPAPLEALAALAESVRPSLGAVRASAF
ncbi:MAG TPA: hypothetical protein PLC40_19925, partial [Candidatus Hydrogenedentes bacterium]|nr:hypothetical protein [Candidatus Hydrogenedentota bacterium]